MILADHFSWNFGPPNHFFARPKFCDSITSLSHGASQKCPHGKNMEWSGLYHRLSCESFKFRCSSPTLPENTALSSELGEFAPINPLSHSLLSSSLLMISACFTVVPTPDLCSLWKCEFKVSWIWVFSCQGSLCIRSCLLSCFKEEQKGAGRWIGRRIVFSRFSGTG